VTLLRAWQLSFCPDLQLACKVQMQFLFAPILTSLQPYHLLLQALTGRMALPCCFLITVSTLATATYEASLGLWGRGWLRAEAKDRNTMDVSVLKVELKARVQAPRAGKPPSCSGTPEKRAGSWAASSTTLQEPAGAGQRSPAGRDNPAQEEVIHLIF